MQRAYRLRKGKVIGGVCAGIAEYFDIDPVLLRIGFAVSFFVYGTGFLLYIILMIALPYKDEITEYAANTTDTPEPQNSSFENDYYSERANGKSKRNLMGGIILVTLGLIFLAGNYCPDIDFSNLWPLLLVAIGATTIYNSMHRSNKRTHSPTINQSEEQL
ncbi:MAG: PspC domain-containing protein [Ignavibacteriae bacterium]|nr:PspC domain-containing protein [Ignavibacteriota bacterium]